MKCENAPKCNRPARLFIMGHHTCDEHAPKPAGVNCSHSLIGSDRCAYCGTEVN